VALPLIKNCPSSFGSTLAKALQADAILHRRHEPDLVQAVIEHGRGKAKAEFTAAWDRPGSRHADLGHDYEADRGIEGYGGAGVGTVLCWGNLSTAWPSFTDFPTDRECCLGNSRVTLVGLIIAIFGVAFMLGAIPLLA
jgi:hypothetical protein